MRAGPWLLLLCAAALACGDRALVASDVGIAETSSDDPTSSSSSTTALDATTTTSTNTSSSDSTGPGESGSLDGSNFLSEPDHAIDVCDPWIQNCPAGTKCMPWANDNSWSSHKCSPLARDPNQPGDPCTVEGSGISGIDDCDIHSMCGDVDPETNMGTCVSLCVGTPESPGCAAPCETCVSSYDGVLNLCLPTCDPVVQECPAGQACFASQLAAIGSGFICAPYSGADIGNAGEPCEFINVCQPGRFCAPPERMPGCQSGIGCCAEFCDATMRPGGQCTFAADGVECVPWFEEPSAIAACIESAVGACLLP